MRIAVHGLWHLGCVTAACLAEAGHHVIGLDPDPHLVEDLRHGRPPLHEPGLGELIAAGQASGHLTFTADPHAALADAELVWVTFDTPVNDDDEADVDFVRRQIEHAAGSLRRGTLVLISSQVPVGFAASLEHSLAGRGLRFACSPENLRLGKALDCFRRAERIVLGCRDAESRRLLQDLLGPFCDNLVWMSVESAEMTKHAVNAFLATSVTFINELARICEAVGADAKEVERGLKSEARIGPKAYVCPGAAFAGGTLARDIRFLMQLGRRHTHGAPLIEGVWASNATHKNWARERLSHIFADIVHPLVAVLGLTYKPGTSTLRRSASVELCRWLLAQGVEVHAHDPAVSRLPDDLSDKVLLCPSPREALAGADVLVIGTEWPEFRQVRPEVLVGLMRRPQVLDPTHFLAGTLGADSRVTYLATGKPAGAAAPLRRCA